jgi:photosystem II stability/assembly factor-like uncharacterized protein
MKISVIHIMTISATILFGILHPSAALDWREYSSGQTKALYGVTYGDGRYLAVGSSGSLVQSPDGASWSALPSFTDINLRGVAYGANVYVAISGFGNGDIWRSIDGTTWTKITSPVSTVFNRLHFINGRFLVVGQSQVIIASQDGASWQVWSENSGNDVLLYDIAYGNGIYAAVGKRMDGKAFIMRSADGGQTWTEAALNLQGELKGLAYGNGLFVAAGGNEAGEGALLTSSDGLNWNLLSNTLEYIPEGVIYDSGLFAVFSSSILLSDEGTQWTEQSTPIKPYYAMCRAQGKLTAVGYRGTILQSSLAKSGPGIYANGTEGAVELDPSGTLNLSVALDPGQYANVNADWWVLVLPEEGGRWYYRHSGGQWPDVAAGDISACQPVYQGALMNISEPVTLLSDATLGSGVYRFYFMVDQRDGIINYPYALVDTVTVTVP